MKSRPEAFPFQKYGEMIASAVARETTDASNQSCLLELLGFGGLVVSGKTVMQDSRESLIG